MLEIYNVNDTAVYRAHCMHCYSDGHFARSSTTLYSVQQNIIRIRELEIVNDRQQGTTDAKNDRENRSPKSISARSYSPHRSKSLNESPLLRSYSVCYASVGFGFLPVLSVLDAVVIDGFN